MFRRLLKRAASVNESHETDDHIHVPLPDSDSTSSLDDARLPLPPPLNLIDAKSDCDLFLPVVTHQDSDSEAVRALFEQRRLHNLSFVLKKAANSRDKHKLTLLHYAVLSHSQRPSETVNIYIKTLLDAAMSNIEPNATDSLGRTAFTHACIINDATLINFLLLRFKNINVNVIDNFGYTALHYSIFKHKEGEKMEKSPTFALLQIGKPNLSVNCSSGSYLHFSIKMGKRDCATWLLQQKHPVNLCDKEKRTPLHLACQKKWHNIRAAIIKEKCDVKARDIHGKLASDYWDPQKDEKTKFSDDASDSSAEIEEILEILSLGDSKDNDLNIKEQSSSSSPVSRILSASKPYSSLDSSPLAINTKAANMSASSPPLQACVTSPTSPQSQSSSCYSSDPVISRATAKTSHPSAIRKSTNSPNNSGKRVSFCEDAKPDASMERDSRSLKSPPADIIKDGNNASVTDEDYVIMSPMNIDTKLTRQQATPDKKTITSDKILNLNDAWQPSDSKRMGSITTVAREPNVPPANSSIAKTSENGTEPLGKREYIDENLKAEKTFDALNAKYQSLTQQNKEYEIEKLLLQEKLQLSQQEALEMQKQIKEIKEQLIAQSMVVKKIQAQHSRAALQVTDFGSQTEQIVSQDVSKIEKEYEMKITELKLDLHKSSERETQLSKEIERINLKNNEFLTLKTANIEISCKVTELQTKVQDLSGQLKISREKLECFYKEKIIADNVLKQVTDENEALKKTIAQMQTDFDDAQKNIRAVESKCSVREKNCQQYEIQIERLMLKNDTAEKEIEKYNLHIQQLHGDNQQLVYENKVLCEKSKEQVTHIAQKADIISQLEAEIKSFRINLQSHESQRENYIAKYEEICVENAKLKENAKIDRSFILDLKKSEESMNCQVMELRANKINESKFLELEKELQDVKAHLIETRQNNASLTQQLENAFSDIQVLAKNCEELRENIQCEVRSHEITAEHAQNLEGQYERAIIKSKQNEEKISVMQQEYQSLLMDNQGKAVVITDLKSQAEKVEKDTLALKNTLENYHKIKLEIEQRDTVIGTLEAELTKNKDALFAQSRELAEIRSTAAIASERQQHISQLHAEINEKDKRLARLDGETELLRLKSLLKDGILNECKEEIQSQAKTLMESRAESQKINDLLKSTRLHLMEQNKVLQTVEAENQKLYTEKMKLMAHLEESLKKHRGEILSATRKIEDLSQNIKFNESERIKVDVQPRVLDKFSRLEEVLSALVARRTRLDNKFRKKHVVVRKSKPKSSHKETRQMLAATTTTGAVAAADGMAIKQTNTGK